MRDINFFSKYQRQNNQKKDSLIYVYKLAALVGAIIVISLGVNTFRIFSLNKSIESYNKKLNASDIQEKLNEAEKTNSKIDVLSKYDSTLSELSSVISKRDNVSDKLLNDICSTIPTDVSFKNLEINNDVLTLQGVSKSREAVGEMQHNLKNLDVIREAFVNSLDISGSVEGEYSFDIKCVIRGVN